LDLKEDMMAGFVGICGDFLKAERFKKRYAKNRYMIHEL